MKRLLCLLIACLLLTGCSFVLPESFPSGLLDWGNQAPSEPTGTPMPTQRTTPTPTFPEPTSSATTAPTIPEISVVFEVLAENGKEYARIVATDQQGNTLWTVETDRYDMAQLGRVTEIGPCPWLLKYYYVDDGDVVALDLLTGFELWRYVGFNGSPAGSDATYIDAAGTVYLCGFFGPDYFAIDTNGNLLDFIPQLTSDYYWAHKLIPGDGKMTVCFSGGPEGDMGPEAHKVDVSTEGYPQVKYGS